MTQILSVLVVLACPIAMGSMMILPALGRLFGRRSPSADTGSRAR